MTKHDMKLMRAEQKVIDTVIEGLAPGEILHSKGEPTQVAILGLLIAILTRLQDIGTDIKGGGDALE